MMPSSLSEVSKTRASPNSFCKPTVARCTPPRGPTSSPKSNMRGFTRNSCSSVLRIASSMFMREPSRSGAPFVISTFAFSLRKPPCAFTIPSKYTKRVACDASGSGSASASLNAARNSARTSFTSASHSCANIPFCKTNSRKRSTGSLSNSRAICSSLLYARWSSP